MSSTFVNGKNSDLQLEIDVVMTLCEKINTPRSLAVYMLLLNKEYQQYLDLPFNHEYYEDISNHADDYLVTQMLKKSPNLPLLSDRKENAKASFWMSELGCFSTNRRLREKSHPNENIIKRRIAQILGPLDERALQEIEASFRHGPGSTATLRGSGLVPSDKFEKSISLTIELYPYYRAILGPRWHDLQRTPVDIVGGNKFTTVPKNAVTDRGICSEPTLNMYVQLGIGTYLRSRLRRFGVDLNDQNKNKEKARRAWKDGLSTIDLSMASDSLARDLILLYFPEPWVELLTLARSHRCLIDGEWHELEKFSSMGNGYTFELESLLFYAVCSSIVPREELQEMVGVYGDDLIVPTVYASALIETLDFLGFKVNQSKSFLAGNFYESCGSDWFKGTNVRPFYLRGRKKGIPYALQIANRLRVYSRDRLSGYACDPRFRSLWVSLYNSLPQLWKKSKVPIHFGDTGIISSKTEAKPKRLSMGHEGYEVRHVVFTPIRKRKLNNFPLLSHLSHAKPSEIPTLGREPKKGYLGRPRLKKSGSFSWTDGLEWLL